MRGEVHIVGVRVVNVLLLAGARIGVYDDYYTLVSRTLLHERQTNRQI